MLRKMFYLVFIFIVVGLVCPLAAQDIDMEIGVGTPVIDGEVDDIWADAAEADFAALEDPADGSGIWKVLYDAENLYVLVDVTDDSLQNDSSSSWQDDSVEIYFDGGNTKLSTPLSGDDHQYTFGWTTDDIQGTNVAGYTDGIEHAQADTDTGWRIEVKMPWMSIWGVVPQAGDLIGIDVYYNDDDDGGDSREGKMLGFSAVEGWNDASQWGTAVLAAEPEPAPTIAWVSYHAADDEPHADAAAVGFTQAPDIGYTDLLKANGYNVTRVLTSQTPDVEYLNTFDLVIISRTASSGHYSGSGASLWNSVTAPMINLNGYTLRSSRLGITDGTTMVDTTGDVRLAVTDPTHPIFAGVSIIDGVMDNMYAEGAVPLPTDGTISRGISINNNNIDDEGTVLATIAEVSADTGPVGGIVIAELPAGATLENSSGSPTDVLGGPRLVFLTGSREPSGVTGGQAAALYDLYPDGEQMFLNAVKYMIPVVPVDPGTDGLVAHYAFENDLVDSSGNGLDGTAIGDPTFAAGVEGMALDLNGDDYIDCGGVAEFSFSDAMTVSTWVNVRSHTAAWMAIVAKGENAWRLGFNNTTTGVHYAFSGGGRGWQAANTATELAFDEWYHVAATYDTKVGAQVYIDGVVDATNPDLDGIDTNQFSMLIGENPEATGRLFDGMLDELMLYDRALSEGEILYLAGFGQNLVLNPSFEEDEDILDDPTWYSWCTWNPAEGAGSNATIVDTDAVDGTRSLLIEPVGPENWHFIVVSMPIPTEVGAGYTASFWAKAAEPRPLGAQWKATDNTESWGYAGFDLTTEWAEYTLTADALNAETKLEFFCAASEVSFLLDSVSVVKVAPAPEPEPEPEPEPGPEPELVFLNGGFEDGVPDPWSTYGDASLEVVQEDPVEGAYCLHVTVNSAGANFWDAGLQNSGHVFVAGKSYTLSAFLKAKEGTMDINFKPERAADPWEGYGDQVFTMTEEWTEFTVNTGVIPETVDPASITFHIAFTAGEFYMDDVRFTED